MSVCALHEWSRVALHLGKPLPQLPLPPKGPPTPAIGPELTRPRLSPQTDMQSPPRQVLILSSTCRPRRSSRPWSCPNCHCPWPCCRSMLSPPTFRWLRVEASQPTGCEWGYSLWAKTRGACRRACGGLRPIGEWRRGTARSTCLAAFAAGLRRISASNGSYHSARKRE